MTYVPVPDPDSARFWAATAQGRLEIQRCGSCGRLQFFPRPACRWCRAEGLEWMPVSGRGTVHSYTVVRRPPTRALADRVPYVVALVDLVEGVRMMTNIVECDPEGVRIGLEVEVVLQTAGDGIVLPLFRPCENGGS